MDEIKKKMLVMANTLYDMAVLIEKGFMEHKEEYLNGAMEKEEEINRKEKEITSRSLDLAKTAKDEKSRRELVSIAQAAQTLERMGDEAASLVERIEVKNAERLLFSEVGVAQYNETYSAMKKSIEMMCGFLKTKDAATKERIIDNGFAVKALVERYRQEHMERLIKGICTPMAANMFFDMLDFTGNIARHASNIVKLF